MNKILEITKRLSNYLFFVVEADDACDIEEQQFYLIQNGLTIYNCQNEGPVPEIFVLCNKDNEPKSVYLHQKTINPEVNIWIKVPEGMERMAIECPNVNLYR